jgi:hypothetical protein
MSSDIRRSTAGVETANYGAGHFLGRQYARTAFRTGRKVNCEYKFKHRRGGSAATGTKIRAVAFHRLGLPLLFGLWHCPRERASSPLGALGAGVRRED